MSLTKKILKKWFDLMGRFLFKEIEEEGRGLSL